jgi:SAM-dependent methyltransferase
MSAAMVLKSPPSEELYGREFFSSVADDSYASARLTWPHILLALNYPVRSIVDFGCGPGAWLAAFRDFQPQAELLDVDHPGARAYQLLISNEHLVEADLSADINLRRSFDLCVSLEVAEHLSESSAESFVRTLTNHSDTILFSAAIPMQGGTGHVNCQWPSYWNELFVSRGFRCFDRVRSQIWKKEAIALHYRQNTLIFSRRDLGPPRDGVTDWGGADIVHPAMFERFWPTHVPRTPRNLFRLIRGTLQW